MRTCVHIHHQLASSEAPERNHSLPVSMAPGMWTALSGHHVSYTHLGYKPQHPLNQRSTKLVSDFADGFSRGVSVIFSPQEWLPSGHLHDVIWMVTGRPVHPQIALSHFRSVPRIPPSSRGSHGVVEEMDLKDLSILDSRVCSFCLWTLGGSLSFLGLWLL